WVKVCPDCQVALVDKLPPEPVKRKGRSDPLVHIATAPNEAVAHMWAGILEENGIRCLVKSGRAGVTMSFGP
ncbi:hypothetical protein ACFLYX_00845, partial [Chloroflexota bacterium]